MQFVRSTECVNIVAGRLTIKRRTSACRTKRRWCCRLRLLERAERLTLNSAGPEFRWRLVEN